MSATKGGYGLPTALVGGPATAPPPHTMLPKGFTIPVYWPGDQWFVAKYDSVSYPLAPGGITQIPGSFVHQQDEKGKLLFDRPVVRKLGPDEIVAGLVLLYGHMGLRALESNEIDNARIKAEANQTFVPFRVEECETIISNHEADVAMALKAKAQGIQGVRLPRPSQAWRDAKRFLDNYDRSGVDGKRYVCSKDGMDFDTYGEAEAWVKTEYRGTDPASVILDTRQNDPKPEEVEPEPEKPKRGRPRKVDTVQEAPRGAEQADPTKAQVREIFLQAGMDGVSLSQDILDGLKSDDQETLAAAITAANSFLNGFQG